MARMIKYGPKFEDDLDRAFRAGQREVERFIAWEQAQKCPNSKDGEHCFDDGRCIFCQLDLEYTHIGKNS